jgi:hypothetical protein
VTVPPLSPVRSLAPRRAEVPVAMLASVRAINAASGLGREALDLVLAAARREIEDAARRLARGRRRRRGKEGHE